MIREAIRRFRQMHEKHKAGTLPPEDRARYEADREDLYRSMVQAQQLALRPGQSARQALRIAREERLMIIIGPRKEGTLTLDIGTGGFAAVVGPLAARIVCDFELHIPGEPVKGRARVVASAKGADGSPRTSFAIEVMAEADKQRLENHVMDVALAALPK